MNPQILSNSLITLLVFVVFTCILFVPEAIFFLSIISFLLILASELTSSYQGFAMEKVSYESISNYTPKVSIHLAICNEPSKLVLQTIESITKLDYPNYELIVVDNNTSDKSKWEPVELLCSGISNIRFIHLSRWPNYKSGALNFARKITCPKAEFIFVVDADYNLKSDALNVATSYLSHEPLGLIQFPQAYILDNKYQTPLFEEFNHFFKYFCKSANKCYGALATGTLSLINICALDAIGGWPINSITEDAELGIRFQQEGYDIKFVDKVIGRGLAPLKQLEYMKQRQRWIYGNAQTLVHFLSKLPDNAGKRLSGFAQLTAWLNFLGLPLVTMIGGIVSWYVTNNPISVLAVTLGIVCFLISFVFRFVRILQVQKKNLRLAVQIFLVQLSSLHIGMFYWWPVLWGVSKPFHRTNKFSSASVHVIQIKYPLLFLLTALFGHQIDAHLIKSGAILIAFLWSASILTDYYLREIVTVETRSKLKLTL